MVHGHGAAGLEVDGESNVSLLNGARLSSDQSTAIRLIDPRSVLNLDIKDRAQLLSDIAAGPQQPDGSPEQARVRVALADGGRGRVARTARSIQFACSIVASDRDGRFPVAEVSWRAARWRLRHRRSPRALSRHWSRRRAFPVRAR